jgi:hypothetical protein
MRLYDMFTLDEVEILVGCAATLWDEHGDPDGHLSPAEQELCERAAGWCDLSKDVIKPDRKKKVPTAE